MKLFYVFLFSAFFNSLLAQGGFGITSNNNLYWEMILDTVVNLESQELQLNPKSSGVKSSQVGIYIRDVKRANLNVQHKEGRTRFLVTEINSNTQINLSLLASIEEPDYDVSVNAIKRDGTYAGFFVKRDSVHLSKIIRDAVIAKITLLSDW